MDHTYLSELDITLWQARVLLPGAKQTIAVDQFALCNAEQKIVALLVIDQGDTTPELTDLRNKMLNAIGLTPRVLSDSPQDLPIIAMGEHAAKVARSRAVTQCLLPHPSVIAQNPELKRKIWEQLKQFQAAIIPSPHV